MPESFTFIEAVVAPVLHLYVIAPDPEAFAVNLIRVSVQLSWVVFGLVEMVAEHVCADSLLFPKKQQSATIDRYNFFMRLLLIKFGISPNCFINSFICFP